MENEADVTACLRRGYAYVAGNNEVMRVACHAKARRELFKPIYFRTRDKANAAVKARRVVVIPRWLERKPGEKPKVTDEWTYCDSVPLQDANNYSDETMGWHKATTETWEETMRVGLVHTSNCGHLRVRYENPAWPAPPANKPDAGTVKAEPELDMSVEPLKWEERNPGDLLVASSYGDESDQYTYSATIDTQASDTEASPACTAMYYNTWLTALPGMNGKVVGSTTYVDKLGQTLSLRVRHERSEHKAWRVRRAEYVKSIEPPFWAERGPGEKVESAGFIKSPDYITFSPDQDLQSGATRSSADGDPLAVFRCWIPAQITDNGIYTGTRRRNPQTGKYARLRVRHESDDHKAWHDTNFPGVCEDGWRFLREGESPHGGDQRKTVSGWRDMTPGEINDGNSCGHNTIRRRVGDGSLTDVDLTRAYHGFVRAGGPIPRIVAEQCDAWATFISRHDIKTYVDAECGVKTEGWPGTADIYLGRAYWNESDAKHGHLIRTWKGPLTRDVAVKLRYTDKVYCANAGGSVQVGQFPHNGGLFNAVFDSPEYQFFLSEAEAVTAAHLLWYRSRVENQMSAITPTQNDMLKPDDVTWTYYINGPRRADANMNRTGCFFSEKAAKCEWLHVCCRDQTTRILEEQAKALEDSDVVFWHDKQGSIQSGSWGSAKQWYFDTPFYFSAKAASTDDAAARECKPSEANDQSELQKVYSNATKFRTMSPGFFHSNSMATWFKANGSHVFVAESDGVKEVAWPRAREVHEGRVHWRYEDAAAHSHELMVKNAGFDKMPVTEARVKLLAAGDRLYYDDNGVTAVVTLTDPGDVLSWPRFKNRQLFLSEEAVAWSRGDGVPTPPKGYRRVSPPIYSIILDRNVMLYNRDEARWRLFDGFNPGPVDVTWNAARGTYFAIRGDDVKRDGSHDDNLVTSGSSETTEPSKFKELYDHYCKVGGKIEPSQLTHEMLDWLVEHGIQHYPIGTVDNGVYLPGVDICGRSFYAGRSLAMRLAARGLTYWTHKSASHDYFKAVWKGALTASASQQLVAGDQYYYLAMMDQDGVMNVYPVIFGDNAKRDRDRLATGRCYLDLNTANFVAHQGWYKFHANTQMTKVTPEQAGRLRRGDNVYYVSRGHVSRLTVDWDDKREKFSSNFNSLLKLGYLYFSSQAADLSRKTSELPTWDRLGIKAPPPGWVIVDPDDEPNEYPMSSWMVCIASQAWTKCERSKLWYGSASSRNVAWWSDASNHGSPVYFARREHRKDPDIVKKTSGKSMIESVMSGSDIDAYSQYTKLVAIGGEIVPAQLDGFMMQWLQDTHKCYYGYIDLAVPGNHDLVEVPFSDTKKLKRDMRHGHMFWNRGDAEYERAIATFPGQLMLNEISGLKVGMAYIAVDELGNYRSKVVTKAGRVSPGLIFLDRDNANFASEFMRGLSKSVKSTSAIYPSYAKLLDTGDKFYGIQRGKAPCVKVYHVSNKWTTPVYKWQRCRDGLIFLSHRGAVAKLKSIVESKEN